MAVHAAFGGSTNLLLHIPGDRLMPPACAGRPSRIGTPINRQVPRLVDALPNGPVGHPTVRVFLAGGVPEVMLHLRDAGPAGLNALTVTGEPLGDVLDWWETSERRSAFARSAVRSRPHRSGRRDHDPGAGRASAA